MPSYGRICGIHFAWKGTYVAFEKFTDKARHVLVLAQEEARKLKQPQVGSEHLLLGLSREPEGMAAQALTHLGITYDKSLDAVKRDSIPDESVEEGARLPFTPRVKRILENALREAMQMGQSYISTEHLLLAIAREEEGGAVVALGHMGLTVEDIRAALRDVVGQPTPVAPGTTNFFGMGEASSASSMLDEFGTDLTAKARAGKLDPVIGRAAEIEWVM